MGFFDELKKLTRPYPYDDEDEDFIDEGGMEPPAEPERRANPFSGLGTGQSAAAQPGPRQAGQRREGRVVSINGGAGMPPTKLVLVKPERFGAAAEIADHLRNGHSIIMNLEETPEDVSRRLLDFLSGVAYALDGKINRAAKKTYVMAPKNADLSGDAVEEMESGGAYL